MRDGGQNQKWTLERDPRADPKPDAFAEWMANVDGSRKLSMLNLSKTHQSLALRPLGITGNPRWQALFVFEQLKDGIRILDSGSTVG